MAVSFADDIRAAVVVYDCMDEFAAFKNAPPELAELEHTLLERADLVFTGGFSLYEAKRNRHPSVHAFPSAVDVAHFAAARGGLSVARRGGKSQFSLTALIRWRARQMEP